MKRARQPPAGHRGRARPGRRRRRRRRRAHRRLALHRRMTDPELKHAVGNRVFDAFAPSGPLQPRRRGPRQHGAHRPHRRGRGRRDQQAGGRRRTCWSTSTSTWWPWTAATRASPPAWPATPACKHHHNVRTMQHSRSFMDQHQLRAALVELADGPAAGPRSRQIFQIETTLNNDTFPKPFDFLQRREWEWSARDRAAYVAAATSLERLPAGAGPPDLPEDPLAPRHDRVQAGEVEAVHPLTTETSTASSWCRSRARPTSSPWACPTSAPTT